MDAVSAVYCAGSTVKGSKAEDVSMRRFQLLRYRDVERLGDVMETAVPIHGAGNFPTLEIKPSRLVQLVRQRLESSGIKVRDVRLNGSAATHVLSDDVKHTYKDLDLIFAIDFPSITQTSEASFERRDRHKSDDVFYNSPSNSVLSGGKRTEKHHDLHGSARWRASPSLDKEDVAEDPYTVDDSGYTSSESSVSSAPASFLKSKKKLYRSRTRSLESMSSTSSVPPSSTAKLPHEDSVGYNHQSFTPYNHSWQEIKDITMEILLDFLPEGVNRNRMNAAVLGGAYVQKLVKITNETDEWSLISLNNNSGRNLEMKFVQSMKRQFEFSVDSFQIILDTYLTFQAAAQTDSNLQMLETFHPTVVAESVYGDFSAALRHLHSRRICTYRPEEIRGGGLLRYCNLLARDFRPGDSDVKDTCLKNSIHVHSCNPAVVANFEQRMCARFFIDFNDIEQQQRKVVSYLDNHFAGEEELKFEYLVVLRRVIDASTRCLMPHERTMILDLITMLVRQTLANNVAKTSADAAAMCQRIHMNFCNTKSQNYLVEACANQMNGPYVLSTPHFSSSDRSSPMSTYSSFSIPTPCESSTSTSPIPPSRPMTPAGSVYYGQSQCNTPMHSQDAYFMDFAGASETVSSFPGYGACTCCGHPYNNHFPTAPYYVPPGPFMYNAVQPVFYDSNTMRCFYQPAGVNQHAQG